MLSLAEILDVAPDAPAGETDDDVANFDDAIVLQTILFALIGSIRPFGCSRETFRTLIEEEARALAAADVDRTLFEEIRSTGEAVLGMLGAPRA